MMVKRRYGGFSEGGWRRWVVYQVWPRSFADSDADGVGDLGGVLSRLDHIQRLGVDVVWLSPVCRSPMDDNGWESPTRCPYDNEGRSASAVESRPSVAAPRLHRPRRRGNRFPLRLGSDPVES
jgi:hypothetical protein